MIRRGEGRAARRNLGRSEDATTYCKGPLTAHLSRSRISRRRSEGLVTEHRTAAQSRQRELAFLVESECDAGGFRSTISVAAPFVWRCLTRSPVAPVSTPLSSNRTCRFAASGSRTRRHAFTHDGPRPSWVRRTIRKCPERCESG